MVLAGRTALLCIALAALTGVAGSQTPDVAIVGVTLADGTAAPPRAGMTVVVRDGLIRAIGRDGAVAIPAGATRIDGGGKFLVPGLWDMHVHLAKAGETSLALFIANGVTSVRDMGGEFARVRRWREEIENGARVGPRIRSAGPIIESASNYRRQVARGGMEPYARARAPVATPDDARRVVDSIAALGADFIKVRTAESLTAFHAIAEAARRRGMPLAVHGDIAPPHEILRAGVGSVEHTFLPPLRSALDDTTRERVIKALVAAQVAVVPTLVNYYQWLLVPPSRARRIVDDSLGLIDPRRRYIRGYLIDDWREQIAEREGLVQAAVRRFYLPRIFRNVVRDYREMHRAGVRLLPGTDVAVALMYPGFSFRDELGYFASAIGMSNAEALQSATSQSAEFMGMLDSLGTIEPGKLADMVLLDADPFVDIRNVGRIHAVIARGRLYDRARLDSLLTAAR